MRLCQSCERLQVAKSARLYMSARAPTFEEPELKRSVTGTHFLTRAPSHTGRHGCTAHQRQRKREPAKDPGAVPVPENQ